MKVLYAGDSPAGGAANYLLGVLKWMKAEVTHVPPSEKLGPGILKKRFDVILLSDFSKKNLAGASERRLVDQVHSGTGLMMVGGWGSFSGPFGGWRGSEVEKILPVTCLDRDDRVNFPGGAMVNLAQAHPSVRGISFHQAPVICGLNQVIVKKNSRVILQARRVLSNGKGVRLEKPGYPLLIIGSSPLKRAAAFAADFAPHWCGGLVDWGPKTLKLPVTSKIQIQVGSSYARLICSLVSWLGSLRK